MAIVLQNDSDPTIVPADIRSETSDYPSRMPETTVCLKRLFMRSIKGSLAGLILTGILEIVPAAAFAQGGGGGGHGFGGGGGGHASIGGGHAFGGFTGRGFSPGSRGMRVFFLWSIFWSRR